ncbi:tetratricopeptide repeat protein [Acidicapsa acidisoli]|uniref:tetratricopeptide repeat protein n=1 Tax=Acidicapsa acidisoli TaxID=1615681 RepID=UPI0021E080B2|nr:tetratricopeptide repeat protein [Acidicapsa acidisoli]
MRKLSELAKAIRPLSTRAVLPCLLFCAALIFGIKAIHGAGTAGADDPPRDEASVRKAYADKMRPLYAFPFAKDRIALPGNAAVEGGDFLEPTAFPDAKYCGHCHQEAYHQWRQSLHANSFRTPFYRTSVNILMRTKGIEFARHCDSCHNPVGILAGALNKTYPFDRSFDRDGLTCMTCHSIQSVQTKLGNGSFVMGVPAVLVDEKGNRIPGIAPDAEILAHLDRHSKAVMQDFLHKPEFCAACHKANLPPMLNDYKWIRAFTAYDEWQGSKFSQQNPLTFYSADYTPCQGCHMKREAITLPDYGAKQGTLMSHRWPAGNTAVPFYYGFDEQLQKTVDFLESGNYLNVDIFALKSVSDNTMAAPLGSVPVSIKPDELVEAYVVVQNKNIGHSLIPEVRDLYEAWVKFTVKDASGAMVYESGFLKLDGLIDPSAHSFTNRPVDVLGDFVDNHKVWTIHSVAYDNTVQAGRSALVRYQFRIPKDLTGPITITAAVDYRHLRQSYLNNVLGKDHPAYPVIELASRSRTFNIGDNPTSSPLPTDNQDWMRWNNVGIGYLDEQQYEEAMKAFEQVIHLHPDYKDGYINKAIVYIEWEKYDEARAPLETALKLHPDDARALYYLALVERRQRHSEAEVADLEKVVAQYPYSRDARRELGISYYQQHRSDDAMQQFKALQQIDPDDLAAHYNLAVLYRRVGMKKQATDEAAQYTMKRIDPGAPTYSLEFLRMHPEMNRESSPWHVHMDRPQPAVAGQP